MVSRGLRIFTRLGYWQLSFYIFGPLIELTWLSHEKVFGIEFRFHHYGI